VFIKEAPRIGQNGRGAFVWRGEQKKVRCFCVERETKEGAAVLYKWGKDAPHPFVQIVREIYRPGAFLRTIL
jgi:hypothetical protein